MAKMSKYERCVRKLKKRKGINPYAVCRSSIKGNRRKKNMAKRRKTTKIGIASRKCAGLSKRKRKACMKRILKGGK